MPRLDADRYLRRIGLDADAVAASDRDRELLARLQSAHARSVPFETLSICGHPHPDAGAGYDGEPIDLTTEWLYEKLVERERGGFCYELNGAFAWLLDDLGFDVQRCDARVASDDGGYGIPADHLTLVVDLDDGSSSREASGNRRADSSPHLVDVGVGAPVVRRPVPLDGSVVDNGLGVEWRLVAPQRPDADYRLEYREPASWSNEETEWTPRYILQDEARELSFFEAGCEYHSTAPDSHFTGDSIAMQATGEGHVTLSPGALTRTVRGETEKRDVEPEAYDRLLAEEIGIRLDET
ncbi:arylamine n-acetyltransferase [Salinarchaeum sp. Harcht-Bsk1]|uniref:arylamine N-acetyltransferase family protein n=1 Tax=Salinarchaeum sp. Harcht-Bsk1 TaxID=1333523 RepID=UPI00034246A9|nr:arylamine N-acetyltransferase [Salinarchaeum sp. Harcht-Bsk1]AGN00822.1 arylamine n-acetyltransferase [Salinarchaeum sp. Harcht-Bsk1]